MAKNNTPKNEWEQQYEREYRRIIQAANRQKKLGYYIPENILPIKPSKLKNVTPEDVERLIELTPQKIRKSSIYIDTDTGEAFPGLDLVNSHHKPSPSKAKIREPSIPKPKQITPKTQTTKEQNKQKQTKTKKTILNNDEKFEEPVTSVAPKENNLNLSIIDKITNLLREWQPRTYWTPAFATRKTSNYFHILTVWNELFNTEDEYEVAYRLEQNAASIYDCISKLIYDSDSKDIDSGNMGWLMEQLLGRPLSAHEADWYSEAAQNSAIDYLRGDNSLA